MRRGSPLVRPLTPDEYPLWTQLVESSPDSCAYHDLRWLQAVCNGVGDRLLLMGMFIDGALEAGLPLQLRQRGPFSLARRPFATPYANPLVDPQAIPDSRRLLDGFLREAARRFSCLSVTGSPFADAPLPEIGYEAAWKHTFLVDVHSPDRLWPSFKSSLRKKINRTLREGYTGVTGCPAETFYSLYHSTYTRQGLSDPFTPSSFVAFLDAVTGSGLGKTFAVLDPEGSPCVARLVVYDRHRAYCALSGSDSPRPGDHPSELLLWFLMQHLSSDHHTLDLVGANIPRIVEFKRKFGGRPVAYPEITRYRTPLEKLAIRLYRK